MTLKSVLNPLLSALFALISISAFSQDGAALYATCAGCHGAQAQGNPALSAPALAGQLPDYTVRQLTNFKNGQRGTAAGDSSGAQMVAMAAMLADDASVKAVADYLAALPMNKPQATINGDVNAGRSAYNSTCSDCHGGNGAGNEALSAPNLTALSDTYLVAQMQKFIDGQRGYVKADRHGRQMAMIAGSLSSTDELRDIAAFLQTLPVAP